MNTFLPQTTTLPPKLRKAIYGSLANSKAVQALEQYHCALSDGWDEPEDLFREIIEYHRKLDELPEGQDYVQAGAENVDESNTAREVVRPLREALCRGDGQFFKDLGEAIEKRKNPSHREALIAYQYIGRQSGQISSGQRGRMTISELGEHMKKAGLNPNVSRVLKDELDIDIESSWIFMKEKPGRKSAKKSN